MRNALRGRSAGRAPDQPLFTQCWSGAFANLASFDWPFFIWLAIVCLFSNVVRLLFYFFFSVDVCIYYFILLIGLNNTKCSMKT